MVVKQNRKRYILFEVTTDKEINFEIVRLAIINSALKLLGELHSSKANLRVLPEFWQKNRGMISVNHSYVPKTKLAIALIKKIGNKNAIITTKRVFGTLKKVKLIFKGGRINGSNTS